MPLLALIVALRRYPGRTQSQLANMLGVTQSTVAADLKELHVKRSTARNFCNQPVNTYELSLPKSKREAIKVSAAARSTD